MLAETSTDDDNTETRVIEIGWYCLSNVLYMDMFQLVLKSIRSVFLLYVCSLLPHSL